MESLKQLLILSITALHLLSCEKQQEVPEDKIVPVSYFLSDQDKIFFFDSFQNNTPIQFADSSNYTLNFLADSIYHITTCKESDLDKGETLSIRYNCLTNYLPNFSFDCTVSARPDAKSDLSIIFATGTFWSEKGNDYNFSWFYLRPNNPQTLHTVNYSDSQINQQFLDSVVLNNTTFYDVFLATLSTDSFSGSAYSKIKTCYYTTEKGVIAFKGVDGRLWVRQ